MCHPISSGLDRSCVTGVYIWQGTHPVLFQQQAIIFVFLPIDPFLRSVVVGEAKEAEQAMELPRKLFSAVLLVLLLLVATGTSSPGWLILWIN